MKFYQVGISTPDEKFLEYSGYDFFKARKEFLKQRRDYFGRNSRHSLNEQRNTSVQFEEYDINRANATELTEDEVCAGCNYLETNSLDDSPFQHNFEEITVFGRPAMFCKDTIRPQDVPAGLHLCYVIHASDDPMEPAELTQNNNIPFLMGSLLTAKPFRFQGNNISIDPDMNWDITPQSSNGGCRYVWEFIEEYDVRASSKTRNDFIR